MKKNVKKVVLAYSGGLDTSVILRWLQETYHCEVVTFTADIGQGEELAPARKKAEQMGVKEIFIDDLREEFVRDFVFPDVSRQRALRRPVPSRHVDRAAADRQAQIEIAEKVGADAVAHGATGKGNDQVRFELGYYALKPDITIIAPWREWDLGSRTELIAYAEKHQIPIAKDKRGEARSRPTRTFSTSRPKAKSSRIRGTSPRNMSIAAPSRPRRRRTSRNMSRSNSARRSRRGRWRSCRPPRC